MEVWWKCDHKSIKKRKFAPDKESELKIRKITSRRLLFSKDIGIAQRVAKG